MSGPRLARRSVLVRQLRLGILVSALAAGAPPAAGDSLVPLLTYFRPTAQTVALIHPLTGTSAGGASSVIRYAVGDVLSFRATLTPLMNGTSRGMGGYVTVYVPGNTEVVGARIVDGAGNTLPRVRGGIAALGWGPRGPEGYTLPLQEGSIAGLYGDTGIFYSTDPRTARDPSAQTITVLNGIALSPVPTGASQLDNFLDFLGPPFYVHNAWDAVQARAFGASGGALGNGTGNTPFGYGSVVAGPQTFYAFEATETSPGVIQATGTTGPWQRIACSAGCEIGTGSAATSAGAAGRVGVETTAGWALSPSNPLPAGTNAVRFAVGELRMGQEEFAEISLRALGSPLDPGIGDDVICAEAVAGDASSTREDGAGGGKDNPWRYCVPGPVCEPLGIQPELDANQGLALVGDQLTFTLRARNLTLSSQTNMVVSQDLSTSGSLALVSATGGPAVAGDVLTWPAITLASGAEVVHTVVADIVVGGSLTISPATYVSDQLPAPGLRVQRRTTISPLAVPNLTIVPAPASVLPGGTVTVTASVANVGTGALNGTGCVGQSCVAIVSLPAGFTYMAGTALINGAPAADPAIVGSSLRFTSGLPNVPPGQTAAITFDVSVSPSTSPGPYPVIFETWLRDPGVGQTVEDEAAGSVLVQDATAVIVENPTRPRLEPPAPNPFHATTRVACRLPVATGVRLIVQDLGGRRVRTLVEDILGTGSHALTWDGTDDAGRPLPSGIYVVRLETAGYTASRKALRIK